VRLVSYATGSDGGWRAGVVVDGDVVDAGPSVRQLLAETGGVREIERRAAEGVPVGRLDELRLGPPVPDPDKILCLGLNYRAHAEESAMEVPVAPVLFAKFRNALVGTGTAVELPAASATVDYEGELAVVIGRRCKHVEESDALSVVAGYMPLNDISARDLQLQTGQWTAGKAPDTFAPCGPALVTADEVGDPQALTLTTRLNGKTVQHASTAEMIFPVASTIAFISRVITLDPGDIIATGTPSGVGQSRTPPLYLKPGDEVEVEISRVGTLRSPIVAAPERADLRAPSAAGTT
jgi:2-keto-4-pentenoate hydratase/2-oxohepta-3-ene-1,7-dioic acid hydratase in catechol pathway